MSAKTLTKSQDFVINFPQISLSDWLNSVLEEQKGNRATKKLMKEFEENLEDLYRLERDIYLAPDEEFEEMMEEIQRLYTRIGELEMIFRNTRKEK